MSVDDDPRSEAPKYPGRQVPPVVRVATLDRFAAGAESISPSRTPVMSKGLRVALTSPDDALHTFAKNLSSLYQPLVKGFKVASVFVEVAERAQSLAWPLVFAPLDPQAKAILEEWIADQPWLDGLVRLARDDESSASIAVATELPSGQTVRATLAIAMGAFAALPESARAIEDATSAAVFARTDAGDPRAWLTDFVAELSHDWPLDIAFEDANRQCHSPPWALLYGHPDDIERSRLSSVANRALREADKVVDDVGSAPVSELDEAKQRLVELLEGATWLHETGDARRVVEELVHIAKLMGMQPTHAQRSAPGRDPEARRLSAACVSGEGASKRGRPDAPLAAGQEGFIEVDVRAPEKDRATHPSAMPDIISSEPDKDEFDLDVFFITALGTQSGKLRLPRSGASTRKVFRYVRPADSAKVTALVVLLYGSRLVQAGELDIDADTHTVQWRETLLVDRALDQVNAGTISSATLASDGGTAYSLQREQSDFIVGMHTPQAGKVNRCLRDALSMAASAASTRGALDEDSFRKLLIEVACAGVILRDQIVSDSVRKAAHIQLIEKSAGEWFPIEFAYDLDAPGDDARVCDRVISDPSARGCDDECRARKDSSGWVCPRHFWGTSKTIERWSLRGASNRPDLEKRSEPLVFCSPSGSTKQLDVLREGIAAFSRLVPADTRQAIEQLCAMTKGGASSTGWAGVVERVRRSTPGLHIVLAHHEKSADDDGWDALEINDDLRIAPRLDRSVVGSAERPPLVLLLACNSLSPDAGAASPVQRYLASGAAAVVATTTLVWAPVVARVAFGLARALKGRSVRIRLGEWLRRQRLELLLERDATAFSLVAYGDAEWELIGAEIEGEIPNGAPSREADSDACRPLREKKSVARRSTP